MNIPFYHRDAHGLYQTSEAWWWVTLRRAGDDVEVRAVEREPVSGAFASPSREERSSDVEALQSLRDRVQPTHARVATHLKPSHVRFATGPIDEARDRDEAVASIVRRSLPSGVSEEEFTYRSQPIAAETERRSRDQKQVLVAMARAEAVARRQALMDEAGLVPMVIGDVRVDVGFAFAFDAAFVNQDPPILLLHDEQGWLMRHANGQLSRAPEELHAAPDRVIEEALLSLQSATDAAPALTVVGPQAPGAVGALDPSSDEAQRAELRTPSGLNAPSDASLDAQTVPGVALAVTALYPEEGALNFRDPSAVTALREEADRSRALTVLLTTGLLLGACLLVVTGLGLFVQHRIQTTDQRLTALSEQLQRVEAAREERNRLRRQLDQSQRLVSDRTRLAPLLGDLGRTVPSGAWLDRIDVQRVPQEDDRSSDSPSTSASSVGVPTGGSRARVTVQGYAQDDQDVADYLSALERTESMTAVRLLVSERLPPSSVFRETQSVRQAVTRFELQVQHVP